MAPRTSLYRVDKPNRDKGKLFHITEMSADQAEDWGMEALSICARSGVDVGDVDPRMGIAGIASVGFQALQKVPWKEIRPLYNRLMDQVKAVPDPKRPDFMRDLVESDTEEFETRLDLKAEVFKLHVNFSIAVAPQSSSMESTTDQPTRITRTKPTPSPRPSRLGRQR